MAGELRTEQSESNKAYSPALPNFEVQNLWTRDNIKALNQTATLSLQSLPQYSEFHSPSQSVDTIASGADGFALFDGSLLASQDTGKPESQPVKTGSELINIAEKLGHDPHRWAQTKHSPEPKCNQYVEAVLQAAHIPIPWKAGHADCHGMRIALDKESAKPGSNWEKVYTYDQAHGLQSDERFTHYKPKDGDVMIWDGLWGNNYVQHSGIAAQPYKILYAGSHHGNSWRRGAITDFTQSDENYGSPTAVYRFKGLK